MGNPIIVSEQDEHVNKKTKEVSSTFTIALCIVIVCCLVTTVLFLWGRFHLLSWSAPIAHDAFGTYGDFIGGFIGTFVVFYSVYLLVCTFKEQIKTNESVIRTNKSVIETNNKLRDQSSLQIFDGRFTTLLNLYKDAISAYGKEGIVGRANFEQIVDDFKTNGLENNTEYKRRSISAVYEYLNLYTAYRQKFSVHLRTLYLLTKLTAEEKIHENYRVSYAKIIRGQLSEGELLILRYNLLSPYGEKMRIYANKFNLLKHLPIMSLLEFTKWRKKIDDECNCSSIDQIYVTIKKILTGMLDYEGEAERECRVSSRIYFKFELSKSHSCLQILFNKQNTIKKGGAIKRPPEEKAFDKISSKELVIFLREIFTELFIYSNFFQYNGNDTHIVKSSLESDNEKETNIKIRVFRKGMILALTDHQVRPFKKMDENNRDA